MLMYKVKIRNSVFLYRDLSDCAFIDRIIHEEPSELEITELYLDRKGSVMIKRPIPLSYMRKIYDCIINYQNKTPHHRGAPLNVYIEYVYSMRAGSWVVTHDSDVYSVVAKFACVMPRVETTVENGRLTPYLTLFYPDKEVLTFYPTDEDLDHIGQVQGRVIPFHSLSFENMRLMDYLTGKTMKERLILREVEDEIPWWRQAECTETNVRQELFRTGADTFDFKDDKFFVPEGLCFRGDACDLKSLVSFEVIPER